MESLKGVYMRSFKEYNSQPMSRQAARPNPSRQVNDFRERALGILMFGLFVLCLISLCA